MQLTKKLIHFLSICILMWIGGTTCVAQSEEEVQLFCQSYLDNALKFLHDTSYKSSLVKEITTDNMFQNLLIVAEMNRVDTTGGNRNDSYVIEVEKIKKGYRCLCEQPARRSKSKQFPVTVLKTKQGLKVAGYSSVIKEEDLTEHRIFLNNLRYEKAIEDTFKRITTQFITDLNRYIRTGDSSIPMVYGDNNLRDTYRYYFLYDSIKYERSYQKFIGEPQFDKVYHWAKDEEVRILAFWSKHLGNKKFYFKKIDGHWQIIESDIRQEEKEGLYYYYKYLEALRREDFKTGLAEINTALTSYFEKDIWSDKAALISEEVKFQCELVKYRFGNLHGGSLNCNGINLDFYDDDLIINETGDTAKYQGNSKTILFLKKDDQWLLTNLSEGSNIPQAALIERYFKNFRHLFSLSYSKPDEYYFSETDDIPEIVSTSESQAYLDSMDNVYRQAQIADQRVYHRVNFLYDSIIPVVDYDSFYEMLHSVTVKTSKQLNITTKGYVHVSFIIEKDGSISNPSVFHTTDKSLNTAAIEIVKQLPGYRPFINYSGYPKRLETVILIGFE